MKVRTAFLAVFLVALFLATKSCSTVNAGTHGAALTWTAPGPLSGATYTYNVQRSNVSGGPYTTIKTGISTTSYTDSGLAAGTKYCYVVTVSAVGFTDSVPSNEACGTTLQDAAPNASGLAAIVQ
jgi:Fibronectin type III domain